MSAGVPNVASNTIELKETLGSGSFGTVYRGRYEGEDVAVKKLKYRSFSTRAEAKSAIEQEVGFLTLLDHPHVVRLLALVFLDGPQRMGGKDVVGKGKEEDDNDDDDDNVDNNVDDNNDDNVGRTVAMRRRRRERTRLGGSLGAASMYATNGGREGDSSALSRRVIREVWLVMEYVARGSLYKVLHASIPPPWEVRLRWARELAVVMGVLHSATPTVYHRDLTSENILVTDDDHIKLTDFGLSVAGETRVLRSFKPAYAAPEVWDADPYTRASDIFSYGVVLYELATLQDPVTALRQGHGVSARPSTPSVVEEDSESTPPPNLPPIPPRQGQVMVTTRASTPSEASLALASIQGRGGSPTHTQGSESGLYTEHSESALSLVSDSDASILSFSKQVRRAVRLSPLVIPPSVPYELAAIIQQCWADSPERRPSAQQILNLLPEGPGTSTAETALEASLAAATLASEFDFGPGPVLQLGSGVQPVSAVRFAFTSDSYGRARFGYACMDGSIHLVSGLEDGDESVVSLTGHTKGVTDFDWSLSGDFVVSASLDKTARVWDSLSGATLRIVYGKAELFAIRFHPLNNNLFVIGSMAKKITVVNMSTGRKMGSTSGSAAVTALTFNPNGTQVFAGDANGVVYACALSSSSGKLRETGRVLAARGRGISSLDYAVHYTLRSSVSLLLAASKDKMVRVFKVSSSGSSLQTLSQFLVFQSNLSIRAAFCPTTTLDEPSLCFAVGSETGGVAIYDTDDDVILVLEGHDAAVVDCAWSGDGRFLVSGDVGGVVSVWERQTSEVGAGL